MKRLMLVICLLATSAWATPRTDVQSLLGYTTAQMDSLDIFYSSHAKGDVIADDVIADIVGLVKARAAGLKEKYTEKYGTDVVAKARLVSLEATVETSQATIAAKDSTLSALRLANTAALAKVQAERDSLQALLK